jgi:hypothetical protein
MGQLTPNAIAPALMPKLPYNAARDFRADHSRRNLAQHPRRQSRRSPQRTWPSSRRSRNRTGQAHYASSGAGSLQHIAPRCSSRRRGRYRSRPFKGSSQAVVDLIVGNVDMNFDSIPAVVQHVKAGKLRAIAVTAAKRASAFPDLPAIAESGYPITTSPRGGASSHRRALRRHRREGSTATRSRCCRTPR